MKLLVDMNLSPRWVSLLASAGIEAVHWSTLGPASTPDAEIMAYTSVNNYIVLTHDLDFSAILATSHDQKPSVVQIRTADLNLNEIGKQVIAALLQMTSDLEEGALVTIDPKRTRLRLLPLPSRA
jgi:predicted nuclease of predicted toxin-antitoxin system